MTGAEALYADMGHFGRPAIRRGWLLLVFPACILSYLGQGALVLERPENIASPFFLLVPDWGRLPMVLLATAATVIASQAVITGTFSVVTQAAQLGYLPRLRVEHTSEETYGQVYVPWVNWVLLVSVLTLVLTFRSSAALAFAFGMAVTGTITITTLLYFYVVRTQWDVRRWVVVVGGGGLLLVDLLFFAANLTKLFHGAWLPLLIAVVVYTVLSTWQRGRETVTRRRELEEGPLQGFVDGLRAVQPPLIRVPGTAVFLNRGKETAPLALRAMVTHEHVLHERVIIVSVATEPKPRVRTGRRLKVDGLGHVDDGILHVTTRFGYMQRPDVPAALRRLRSPSCPPRSTSTRRPSTCPSSSCTPATSRRWRAGANGCSSRRHGSRPTRRSTSTCRPSGPWSWAPGWTCERGRLTRWCGWARVRPPRARTPARAGGPPGRTAPPPARRSADPAASGPAAAREPVSR